MAILPPTFRQRYFSASGLPLSGGKMYTYAAGTTTPLATYTDATEASSNTNPVILDANGECNLWLGGFAYKIVLTDSNDVTQWTQDNINQASIDSAVSADLLENLGITCQALPGPVITISVKTGAGNTPSPTDPIRVGFRGGSLSSGLVSLVNITSPLAMNLANGATLGQSDGVTAYTYVYLINNNGAAELAVSSSVYQENALISTTIMNSSSDSSATIYSTVARTNVPIRLIARLTMNQTTAGDWVSVPTEIQTGEEARRAQINTGGIADLAITTAKLADGAVTNVKRAALGQQISSSSGSFSSTSGSEVDVTNLSVSITTVGRPVFVGLIPDGVSSSGVQTTRGAASAVVALYIYRGVSKISTHDWTLSFTGPTAVGSVLPPGCVFTVDPVAAGTYTYKIAVATLSSAQISVSNCKLIAFEL